MDGNGSGEWLTIAQASERAGVSADAMRRRVKRGQVAARKVETPYGPTWMIAAEPSAGEGMHNPPSPVPPSPSAGEGPPAGGHDLGDLLALLRDCQAKIDAAQADLLLRTEAAAAWQGRAEVLAAELARTREQLALMAPKDEPEPPHPWWRFWRG